MPIIFGAELLAEIAMLARHQTQVDFCNKEPNIQQLIHNIFYMDDIVHSYDNLLEVQKSIELSRRYSKMGGFNSTNLYRVLQKCLISWTNLKLKTIVKWETMDDNLIIQSVLKKPNGWKIVLT